MALPQEATAEELLSGLPHRLHHVFQPWAESSPDQPALIGDGKVWTYGQLPGIVDGAALSDRILAAGADAARAHVQSYQTKE